MRSGSTFICGRKERIYNVIMLLYQIDGSGFFSKVHDLASLPKLPRFPVSGIVFISLRVLSPLRHPRFFQSTHVFIVTVILTAL